MTAQDLKNAILQLAVQGKLVPQDPNDEPASELLKRIKAEKERLIKEGKIKKEKPLASISDDEIPFDIPESWKWVRLGDYCLSAFSGKSPIYEKTPTDYWVVGQAANQENGLDLSQIKYTTKSFWESMEESFFLRENDVLLNTLGHGTLGRSGIVKGVASQLLTDGHLFVFRHISEEASLFFWYFLQYRRPQIEKSANGSTNQTFLSLRKTCNWIVPIPPLAEQKRIVAKIEELMPLVEEYGKAEERLTALNAEFPDKLRKSILQQAIQGKLTECDPADEPASELLKCIRTEKEKLIKEGKIKKEKPLPPITEEEIPFEIPDRWKWVRLDDLVCIRGGKRMPKGKALTTTPTEHIYVRVTDMQNGTILDNDLHYVPDDVYPLISKYIIEQDDVYIVIVGSTIGKTGIVPARFDRMNLTENAVRLTPIMISKLYLKLALETDAVQTQLMDRVRQEGQPKLAIIRLRSALIPLPPLAEQQRIVDRVNELLAVCDELK